LANSPQAIKRARQAEKHRAHNVSQKSAVRSKIKKLLSLILAKDKESAMSALKTTTSSIDRIAKRGLIHANTGARLKSRLNKKVKAI
jgi:small subunit ribosomal protein S20